MMNHEALFKQIAETLVDPNGIVQVTTYTRSTVYEHKHASWFSFDAKGVYVRQGKSKVAIHFASIRFGKVA